MSDDGRWICAERHKPRGMQRGAGSQVESLDRSPEERREAPLGREVGILEPEADIEASGGVRGGRGEADQLDAAVVGRGDDRAGTGTRGPAAGHVHVAPGDPGGDGLPGTQYRDGSRQIGDGCPAIGRSAENDRRYTCIRCRADRIEHEQGRVARAFAFESGGIDDTQGDARKQAKRRLQSRAAGGHEHDRQGLALRQHRVGSIVERERVVFGAHHRLDRPGRQRRDVERFGSLRFGGGDDPTGQPRAAGTDGYVDRLHHGRAVDDPKYRLRPGGLAGRRTDGQREYADVVRRLEHADPLDVDAGSQRSNAIGEKDRPPRQRGGRRHGHRTPSGERA